MILRTMAYDSSEGGGGAADDASRGTRAYRTGSRASAHMVTAAAAPPQAAGRHTSGVICPAEAQRDGPPARGARER